MSCGLTLIQSQCVRPVRCSWGLWLLLNASRCLPGFLLVPTRMFVGVWTVKWGEKANRTPPLKCPIQCCCFRPSFSPPTLRQQRSARGSAFAFTFTLTPNPLLDSVMSTCTVHLFHTVLFLPSTRCTKPPLSLHLSVCPLPVLAPICQTHKMHIAWKTNTPFLCLPLPHIAFKQGLKEVSCCFLPNRGRTQCLYSATVPLCNILGTMKRHNQR